MTTLTHNPQELITFLKSFRDEIIAAFEEVEGGAKFEMTPWDYKKGEGGGEINVLRGKHFEKAAVNWSGVKRPGLFATGVSLITHMQNPFAPTVHMNVRYMENDTTCWFGGGYDLTPMGFPIEEDTTHFLSTAKTALDPLGEWERLHQWAKEYFTIPHWNKERGIGGIFFDNEPNKDIWLATANSFLEAIIPIYKKRIHTPYTPEDKAVQNKLRGHYVEFNLLYDRGTKFGFQSGGNPEAILCSMPPTATW